MATFENLYFAVLTKNEDDADTSSTLNMTVDIDGQDIFDQDYPPDMDEGEAELLGGGLLETPLDIPVWTNSSIRLGIRDDDAWGPQHVLVFGQTQPGFVPGQTCCPRHGNRFGSLAQYQFIRRSPDDADPSRQPGRFLHGHSPSIVAGRYYLGGWQ